MELTTRKRLRLNGFDYDNSGYYFVTVCTAARYENVLCSIRTSPSEEKPVTCPLTPAGEIVSRNIERTDKAYLGRVLVDSYVVMPDHIHLLLLFCNDNKSAPVTLPKVINTLKGLSSKEIGYPIWQRSYYDHVIRDTADLQAIRVYIQSNPENWAFKE